MPYPSATLYPGARTFPGVPPAVDPSVRSWLFQTPVEHLRFRMEGNLFATAPYGLSVWRIGGVWAQGMAPAPATVAAADRFYRGGYAHRITPTEAQELSAAGYTDSLTDLGAPT